MANNVPASLKNCQVSLNKITGKPQVVIKSYTVIDEAGNADIKVDDPATLGSPSLTVDKLDTLDVYDRVTLCVTVLQVKDPVQVSTGKTKQEVIIGDKTGNVTLTLWEHNINTLQENCSYQLSRVQVHEFSGRRELSLPSFGATINPIEDLQDICRVHSEEDNTKPLVNAFIVAVNQLESVFSCVHCKKNIAVSDETIVTCDTCGTAQRLRASSKVTARLYIQNPSGKTYSLRDYNDVLASIT